MSVGDVACAQYNQLILVELLAPCDNDFNSVFSFFLLLL